MNTIPLPLLGNQYLCDNSGLQTIMTCPRQGMINNSLKLRAARTRPALHFGKAIHAALEFRDRSCEPMVDQSTEDGMVEILMSEYEGVCFPGDFRSLDFAIDTIRKYNLHYMVDDFLPYMLKDGTPAVEIPFALPIAELEVNREMLVTDPDLNDGTPTLKYLETIQILFTGKIDRLCKKKGQLYILDHKTTSMGGAGFFEEFYTGLQFKGYTYAAQQLTGEEVAGAVINALFTLKPTRTGKGTTFARQTIQYHPSLIAEWKTSFISTVKHFIELHMMQPLEHPERAFPQHTQWCKGKYGKCEYFDVCSLPVPQRDSYLFSSMYEDNTWNPLTQEDPVKQSSIGTLPQNLGNTFSALV